MDSISGGGESLDDIFGDTIGADPLAFGSGGGEGGTGMPPTPGGSGLIQQLTDALGITGTTATTAATFPALLSQIDAALAAQGIAPLGEAALGSLSTQFASGFPELAAALGFEEAGAGAIGAGAAGAAAGAEAGAGGGLIGAGAGSPFLGAATGIGAALSIILGALFAPRGQPAKDIKAEGKIIASAQNDIRNALQNKAPIDLDRLRVTGSFTKNAQGRLVGTNGHAPKLLAALLNAGQNIPKVKGAIGTAADVEGYVVPMEVTQGTFKAGRSLNPNPNDPLLSMQIFIPAKAIKVMVDEVTGQTTYRARNDPTLEQERAERERDRKSEARSISRQD